jgi:hypothetical protein
MLNFQQEVWRALNLRSDPAQEGQGFSVCPGKTALLHEAEWLWWTDQANFLKNS